MILQNAPAPAGCALSPERVAEIVVGTPGVEYVKEEVLPCGQRMTRVLALATRNLRGVFGGAGGRYITDELARGACGTMPACELSTCTSRSSPATGAATPPACGGCSTGCCRCSTSRRCSGWR